MTADAPDADAPDAADAPAPDATALAPDAADAPDARAPEPAPAPSDRPAARLIARLRPLLPWVSLASGIAGAVWMDRAPERGALVAAAAVALWILLLVLLWLARVSAVPAAGFRRWLLLAARLSSLLAAQSLVQLALFFALPFYLQAATYDVGHGVFLVGLIGLSAASLWDPLTERLLTRPLLAPLLPAIASFVALAAVLPGLGLSTRTSLWTAAFTAGAGVFVTAAASAPAGRRARAAGLALLAAAMIPLALWLGAVRIVPAAPLRLSKIEIGSRREGHWVADPSARFAAAPERLVCATAIWSPLGVKDRLFHVWTRDGKPRARVELDIRGGRSGGYRTFSRVAGLGRNPAGVYRCSVQTQSGQVLGSRSVRVDGR
jgi:hypothetical protein